MNYKICTKCNISKSIDEFHWAGKYKNGSRKRNPRCKICMNEYDRIRSKTTKRKQWAKEYNKKRRPNLSLEKREQRKKRAKEWFENLSPEKRAIRYKKTREWAQNQSEDYKKERREEDRRRYQELSPEKKREVIRQRVEYINQNKNIDFKMRRAIRSRFAFALKRMKKNSSITDHLDCSVPFLKKYLESKFKPGMNWENYGFHGWHIDHIKPLSLFDLSDFEQRKEAFHYTNLQPLWAKDNFSKGAKLEASNG